MPESKHTHAYNRSKPTATVETCSCGRFRHTEHAGPSIAEIPASKHTPGYENESIYAPSVKYFVASMSGGEDVPVDTNARLIATAPELLAFIKRLTCGSTALTERGDHACVHAYDDHNREGEAICRGARALLARVEGGE